jgi:hypothetical protein
LLRASVPPSASETMWSSSSQSARQSRVAQSQPCSAKTMRRSRRHARVDPLRVLLLDAHAGEQRSHRPLMTG